MRILAIPFLALALSGIGYAADPAPSPVTPAELPAFLPAVLPALKPDEQAALSTEMQTAGTNDALAVVVTKYALVVQGRGTKLPHPVTAAAAAPTAAPAKPVASTAAELPGARPIATNEINDFSAIIREQLFNSGELDAFITEAQKERTLEGQVAVMNRYAAKLQARGVKLPHPVLADGSVPPVPGASSVEQDPEARVPTTIDPEWVVATFDGDDKAIWNITKKVGRRIHRTYYDTAGFREREETFPDGPQDPSSDNPKDWLIERSWTQNQRLRSLGIPGRTFAFPVFVQPTHPLYATTKQVIVWNDPKDQTKGPRSATLLPISEPDGSTAYVGAWRAWDAAGNELESGQMEKGQRTGDWVERTFAKIDGNQTMTSEAKGSYINGKRSGTWNATLFEGHPDVEKAIKDATAKPNALNQARIDGFLVEQIYEGGTVVKETRNF